MTHLLSAPVALEAQGGSISGTSVSCSCGFEARTSLSAMFAVMEANNHVAYMRTAAASRLANRRAADRLLMEGA